MMSKLVKAVKAWQAVQGMKNVNQIAELLEGAARGHRKWAKAYRLPKDAAQRKEFEDWSDANAAAAGLLRAAVHSRIGR